MEPRGKRIARLRIAKGWSRPELGRRMAAALGRKKPFSGELIRLYEKGDNDPGNDARRALAAAFDRTEAYIEFGDSAPAPTLEQAAGDYDIVQDAKEGIALHLFRGLVELQQRELIREMRALFDANQLIRKQMGGKPLQGVSNEAVERAFGAVPPPRQKRRRKDGHHRRESGDAMGDFLDE